MLITIRNDFHGTSARVRTVLQGGRLYVSHRTMLRVRAALCGVEGCTCGGALGERGPQEVEITECAFGAQPSVCEITRIATEE